MRNTSLNMVLELARTDKRICFIGSDLGAGTLKEFQQEMPERFFMEGISEQHVVGMAAGMALEGRIPYVNTIAAFLTRRCYEQVVLDLCLQKCRVRLIGNGGGLVYAPLGPTHTTVEDLAVMRALPGMHVFAPADAEEMRRLMPLTVDLPGPAYIRLAKGYDPIVSDPGKGFEVGRGILMREGRDALVVCTGICLGPALEAAAELEGKDIATGVLHMPTLKPFDAASLCRAAAGVRAVVSIEEHSVIGGLGSAVAEVLLEAGIAPRFRRLGIPDSFPCNYGSQKELMAHFGIDTATLVRNVQELCA